MKSMRKKNRWLVFLLAVFLLSVQPFTGCSQWKPFKAPVSDDIPEGPGLLSGEDGEFVIYRKKKDIPEK